MQSDRQPPLHDVGLLQAHRRPLQDHHGEKGLSLRHPRRHLPAAAARAGPRRRAGGGGPAGGGDHPETGGHCGGRNKEWRYLDI
jgi:hypothetical protein